MSSSNRWTTAQLELLREVVAVAMEKRTCVDWISWSERLGHSVGSCKVMACAIRKQIGPRRLPYQHPEAWTPSEIARMRALVLANFDRSINWPERYAEFPGRSLKACTNYAGRMRKHIRAERGEIRRAMHGAPGATPIPQPETVLEPAPEAASFWRGTSTAKLMSWDAFLSARVAEQGATAGLCGDPLPGRSALDRKRGAPTP
jgi:hypothetical protein